MQEWLKNWSPDSIGDLILRIGIPVGIAAFAGWLLMKVLVAYFEGKKK
jgi:hypothetical protein